MNKSDIPFLLFANCKLIQGVSRSTICDLQKGKIHLIPNSLFDILNKARNQSINQIKQDIEIQYHPIIDEYFEFLEREELIFFTNYSESFPPLSDEWDTPSKITNSIIDVSKYSTHNYVEIIKQLNDLDCQYLEIRIFDKLPLSKINSILSLFKESTISSINLILPYNEEVSDDDLINLCKTYKCLTGLIMHDSPKERTINSPTNQMDIIFVNKRINSELHCGIIGIEKFVSNISSFTESLHHNSCLNRKISIDSRSNIKNCPSMKESFGNIKDTTLQEVIEKPGFKKYWNITKDLIAVCKDCEFRHVCTDCRAYLEEPENKFSKPLKCGYDPLSCTWSDWSSNPLKNNSINHYSLQEIIK